MSNLFFKTILNPLIQCFKYIEIINSTEAAKVRLGSENVNPKKLKGAAEYLKKYWQQQKQRN